MLLDRRERTDGFLFGIFLILYGIARFTVDFFRFYENQMFLIDGIGFNQMVSFLLVLAGAVLLYPKKEEKP
jgi:prolipoprotein diacylglyceryltransferase